MNTFPGANLHFQGFNEYFNETVILEIIKIIWEIYMKNLYICKLELGFMIDEYWHWVCFQIFVHFVMGVE